MHCLRPLISEKQGGRHFLHAKRWIFDPWARVLRRLRDQASRCFLHMRDLGRDADYWAILGAKIEHRKPRKVVTRHILTKVLRPSVLLLLEIVDFLVSHLPEPGDHTR